MMRFSSVEIFEDINQCIHEIEERFWELQKGKVVRPRANRLTYFSMIDS